jgi:uncharacterized protein YjbI with pentapeptide repeats
LTGANFKSANLLESNLEGIELARAWFLNANFSWANLTGSRMRLGNFENATFNGAKLAEIDWEGANLRNADLRGVDFHMGSARCGLLDSDIACEGSRTGYYTDESLDNDFRPPEEYRKANLRGADLRGAKIHSTDFYLVDLRDALLDPDQLEHLRSCRAIL